MCLSTATFSHEFRGGNSGGIPGTQYLIRAGFGLRSAFLGFGDATDHPLQTFEKRCVPEGPTCVGMLPQVPKFLFWQGAVEQRRARGLGAAARGPLASVRGERLFKRGSNWTEWVYWRRGKELSYKVE